MATINFCTVDSNEIDLSEIPFNPFSKHRIPLFGKPIEIGHFSIDCNKKLHFDKSQMKYLLSDLQTQNLNFDLNADYAPNSIHQYNTKSKLYKLLRWIAANKVKWKEMDFVTVRGTLCRIMCTPYSEYSYHKRWCICASKYKEIIYLTAIDDEADLLRTLEIPELLQYQAWGYKFEHYVTSSEIDGYANLKPRENNEEFCIVLRNKLNNFTLLYQAEIDAVLPHYFPYPGSGDTSCYVELKTSKILSRISDTFHFKSSKLVTWWAQSYLTGISDIICGRRTNQGIVKYLDIYRVSSIPEMAYGLWSSEVCLNFCDRFLKFIKKTVVEDNPDVVYKFSYEDEKICCKKIYNPEDEDRVIPDWYLRAMER